MNLRIGVVLTALCGATAFAQTGADQRDWVSLFNGRDLDGWTPKIAKHAPGENFANTFRVEQGVLKAAYDAYGGFDDQFGHLFHRDQVSFYHLVVEYRFTGAPHAGTPEWAYRNSGVMLHAQSPASMRRNQDFPISLEFQFLGGFGDGKSRTTGNMCSPGTEVFIGGAMSRSHCVNSASKTYDGDQWVRAEAIVLGDSLVTFIVGGDTVLTLSKPRIGGGAVNGFDPAVKQDGKALTTGYIALQSEGHAVEFRKVELLNLSGCTDKSASSYRNHFVHSDPAKCGAGKAKGVTR
jgi:hypothetical protein